MRFIVVSIIILCSIVLTLLCLHAREVRMAIQVSSSLSTRRCFYFFFVKVKVKETEAHTHTHTGVGQTKANSQSGAAALQKQTKRSLWFPK